MVFKSELSFDDLLRAGLKVPLKDAPSAKKTLDADGDEPPQDESEQSNDG